MSTPKPKPQTYFDVYEVTEWVASQDTNQTSDLNAYIDKVSLTNGGLVFVALDDPRAEECIYTMRPETRATLRTLVDGADELYIKNWW